MFSETTKQCVEEEGETMEGRSEKERQQASKPKVGVCTNKSNYISKSTKEEEEIYLCARDDDKKEKQHEVGGGKGVGGGWCMSFLRG